MGIKRAPAEQVTQDNCNITITYSGVIRSFSKLGYVERRAKTRAQADHASRWLLVTVGLNSVPLKSLELHFKGRKRKGYLELLECMFRREGGYHNKLGGLLQSTLYTGLRWRGHLGLPIVPQIEVVKPLTVCQIYVAGFTKFIRKAHIPHLPHRLCQSKGTVKGKVPHQDCPSDSGKVPHGDTVGYLPRKIGQLALVTIT